MVLSYKWLSEFVNTDVSPKEFADSMTMSGSKVEAVHELGGEIQNVVVGKIESVAKHPNADKLSVCMIDVGNNTVQVVTGATNVKAGDSVPVALDGSTLPGGVKINAGKLRGIDSFGMLCSINELGLTKNNLPDADEDGILILDGEAKPGTDIRTILGLDDIAFEFEITSNRPDCMSVIGLAREAAATFGKEFKAHTPEVRESDEPAENHLSVSVEDPDLCPRYTARMVCDVKIEPSPKWMRERLHASGIRPINNIVDITNYVMLEYGQPMHAFDYRLLGAGRIVVRRAKDGEKITTIDEREHTLNKDMLVIADESLPVAVAGVMGGANSEIGEDTNTVVFESACFKAASVRNTSRALGLRTDSSARFEKGLDAENALPALERACELVESLGAGRVLKGVIDVKSYTYSERVIPFDPKRINALLGTDIDSEKMKEILKPLGFSFGDGIIGIPSFRADIECTADIAEEVARLYGYNNIESTPLRGENTQGGYDKNRLFEKSIGATSRALGFSECFTYSFINPAFYDRLMLPEGSNLRKYISIRNPLGDETSAMRTTLIPSMLEVISKNISSRNMTARFYELGRVYLPKLSPDGEADLNRLPDENAMYILGSYGKGNDFYTLKGALETLFKTLLIADVEFEPASHLPYHPGRCAKISSGDLTLGVIGEIHPKVLSCFDIDIPVYLAELSVEALMNAVQPELEYKPLPKFPAITRDIALVCDINLPVSRLEKCIRSCSTGILEDIVLFDVYTGGQVEKDKKSVAFSLTLRSPDHTLRDDEADAFINKALLALKDSYGALLRE